MSVVQQPKAEDPFKEPSFESPLPPPANSREYLTRQPSKLADEQNPFEKSFSRSSVSAEAEAKVKVEPGASPVVKGGRVLRGSSTTTATANPISANTSAAPSPLKQQHAGTANGAEATPPSDPNLQKLPGITSITTPDGIVDSIPSWSASAGDATSAGTSSILESSLRSGPLSPAMLTAPQNATVAALRGNQNDVNGAFRNGIHNHTLAQHNGGMTPFDPSQFVRTGLTPGATGLTPLTGGNPSGLTTPNTAAFLAMVNNATSGVGMDATGPPLSDLTPGTHSAIYGVVNGFSFENGADNKPPAGQSEQPDYFSHRPTSMQSHVQHHTQQDPSQQPQNQYHNPQHYQQQPQYIQPDQYGMMPPPPAPQNYNQHPQQHQMHPQQQIPQPLPSPSENGLLLLTQAHQELSKRERDVPTPAMGTSTRGAKKGKAAAAATQNTIAHAINNSPRVNVSAGSSSNSYAANNSGNGNKRKSDPAPTKRGGKKAKNSAPPTDDGMSDDDDDSHVVKKWEDVKNKPGPEGETEEEKRKNFLERNRQAALKCRQRKKAWLNQLQAKVESLTQENDHLTQTNTSLRDDVTRLSTILLAHRDCPVAPKLSEMTGIGYGIGAPGGAGQPYQNGQPQPGQYAPTRV